MHPHEEEFALAVETALNQEIKTVVFTYANFGFITHSWEDERPFVWYKVLFWPPSIDNWDILYVENTITDHTAMSSTKSSAQWGWNSGGCDLIPWLWVIAFFGTLVIVALMHSRCKFVLFLWSSGLKNGWVYRLHQESQDEFRRLTMKAFQQASKHACSCCIMSYQQLSTEENMREEIYKLANVLSLTTKLRTGKLFEPRVLFVICFQCKNERKSILLSIYSFFFFWGGRGGGRKIWAQRTVLPLRE